MKFTFDTNYSEKELEFIKKHNCEILSEIKLSKTDFSVGETPRRMFRYYGTYVGEIIDDETKDFCWGILSKYKGLYRFTSSYETLELLEMGI